MYLIVYILFLHWLGDFVLQSDRMAKEKSTSWVWLSNHVNVYQLTLLIGLLPIWDWERACM